MKLAEICAIAKAQNISPGKLTKKQLIKAIQTAEGNFDCFSTARNKECDQVDCCWRLDCFEAAK
jgi:hypothetical protein